MGIDLSPVLDRSDTDNPEEHKHIVNQHLPGNSIADAIIFGTEITALCGYRWIPTKDPDKYPLCQSCRLALEAMPH